MQRSPEQRFQRTTNPSVSPTTSATRMSPKYNPINKQSRESNLVKNSENTNIKERSKQQVDDRIENLQKMLDNEKSKRQVQFNQLYKMINQVKDSKPSRTENDEPSFLYGELEFPMTPRVKARENEVENDQREYKFQTYTPIIETVSKAKESRHRNYMRDTQDYRNPEEYTLKSVEMLLQKIEREAEYNNRNIFRIQQQISSIRSLVINTKQRSPKAQEIPQQIHKYIKESHNFLKSQIEADRNMLKKLIVQEVEEQVSIKIKQYRQEKATPDKNQGLKKLQTKMEEMSVYFQQQLKILDEKSDNQIDTLNEIVEEKFSFFKDTILDHVLKYTQEDSNRLSREIEKQKSRISSIQQANAQFFIDLEKTMGSIQQKLKLVKQSSQHERQLKDVQILRSLKQEQDIFFEEISQQFHRKMADHQQEALTKIRQLSQQVEKMQDLISPPPKFKVSNQNNSSTKNTISPEFESQVNDLSKISKRTNQHELSFEHGNKYMKNEEEQEINQKFNQIMELISENCNFLQSRNYLFEDSMAEIVSVLNDIVEKLKLIM